MKEVLELTRPPASTFQLVKVDENRNDESRNAKSSRVAATDCDLISHGAKRFFDGATSVHKAYTEKEVLSSVACIAPQSSKSLVSSLCPTLYSLMVDVKVRNFVGVNAS